MDRKTLLPLLGAFLGAALATALPPSGNEMTFTVIRDPDNPADTNGYGSVKYAYKVQQTRVTNAQYARFLNAVAPEGQSPLFHEKMESAPRGGILLKKENPPGARYVVKKDAGEKPVTFISWQDAARYANWLHNGATPNASTENGAYNMAEAGTGFAKRSADARFWIPNRDELYKAIFYKHATGYTREPQLLEAVAEGRFHELVEDASRPPLTPVAENGSEPVPLFEESGSDARVENEESGFRVATLIDEGSRDPKECRDPKQVAPVAEGAEEVGEAPPALLVAPPGGFLMSPFISPGVAQPIIEETPAPSPTPVS